MGRIAGELAIAVRIVSCGRNRGKGRAVAIGMAEARGEAVLMSDADLSTPIEELDELLPHLENGAQVVIGSRRLPGADIEVRQPRLRQMMGSVFTMLTRALVVRVTDDGPGVPDEIRARIFDPFFTTKAPGEGTGLGLDIARRVVYRHGGDVDVESTLGHTEFRVTLPTTR